MKKILKIESIVVALFLFCSLQSCSVINPSSGRNRIPSDGLVAYYPFNYNASDWSGNNNDGIVFGAVLTSDRNGNKNSAYAFDGKDDFIYIPDSEILRVTGQITISAWFRTGYALPFAGIVCKADAMEPRCGYLLDINNYGNLRADLYYDHSEGIGASVVSDKDMTDNMWHHALVTYDGRVVTLYIDGEQETQVTYDRGLKANKEPLLIGWDENPWLSHRHFKGSIDDVRIYNRILNKDEIKRLCK